MSNKPERKQLSQAQKKVLEKVVQEMYDLGTRWHAFMWYHENNTAIHGVVKFYEGGGEYGMEKWIYPDYQELKKRMAEKGEPLDE